VDQGVAVGTIASHYEIPRSTLRSHVTGISKGRKRGKAPVLIVDEEQQLVDYIIQMQGLRFPLSLSQLKLKVALITHERATPFVHGIPGARWLRWFRRRHLELALRLAQGLDTNCARGLCPANVNTFYNNLSELYERYKYPPSNIWNCNESGAQAGQNGGAYVLAKRGSHVVHSVIPNKQEWLTVLTCINASGQYIPNFYIFKGMHMRHNYIRRCESGATMAMSRKAWMTGFLFSAWIDHFIQSL
jgi:hypothetical protein